MIVPIMMTFSVIQGAIGHINFVMAARYAVMLV